MKMEELKEKVKMVKNFIRDYEGVTDFPIDKKYLINYNRYEKIFYLQYMYNVNDRNNLNEKEVNFLLMKTILKNYNKDNLIGDNISKIEHGLYHLVTLWEE